MRRILTYCTSEQFAIWSPHLIAVGLALLVATIWWAAMPATSGMALIALGATGATISRFQSSPGFHSLLLLHLTLYGGLYALCVGARLDTMLQPSMSLRVPILVDLAASIWPAAATLLLSGNTLISQPSAD